MQYCSSLRSLNETKPKYPEQNHRFKYSLSHFTLSLTFPVPGMMSSTSTYVSSSIPSGVTQRDDSPSQKLPLQTIFTWQMGTKTPNYFTSIVSRSGQRRKTKPQHQKEPRTLHLCPLWPPKQPKKHKIITSGKYLTSQSHDFPHNQHPVLIFLVTAVAPVTVFLYLTEASLGVSEISNTLREKKKAVSSGCVPPAIFSLLQGMKMRSQVNSASRIPME